MIGTLNSRRSGTLLAVLCLAIAGCGEGKQGIVPVSGTVLMNDKPLTGYTGYVRVVPAGERAATGKIDPNTGRFTLTTYESGDGCQVGTHPVAVIVNTMVGMKLVWLIPEQYGNHKQSGLTATIEGETDDLELRLTGKLKPPPKKPAGSSDEDLEGVF